MIENKQRLALALLAIVVIAAGKPPPPPGAPWAKFAAKPAFARSLGPPPMPEVGTFSIPYVVKPSMFPKFVDPRIMIAKKTDLLANLFGGVGPVVGPPGFGVPTYSGYGSDAANLNGGLSGLYSEPGDSVDTISPILYAEGLDGERVDPKITYFRGIDAPSTGMNADSKDTASDLKRGLLGPAGSKSSFGGAFGSKGLKSEPFDYGEYGFSDSGVGGPSLYYKRGTVPAAMEPLMQKNKRADSLNTLFKDSGSPTVIINSQTTTTEQPVSLDSKTHIGSKEVKETKESTVEKTYSPVSDAVTKPLKDLTKRMVADASIPTLYAPGMFGPMAGPYFGPPTGAFGPDAFMSKKSMFLDTLFKNLATSTPSPVTDIPVAKSTIVPPGFWFPESIVPEPGAYNAKVETFLEKLFDSLKLNSSTIAGDSPVQSMTYEESISAGFPGEKTAAARSLASEYSASGASPYFSNAIGKSTRSLADPGAVVVAKDQIVNSIIGELGILKDDMVSTFNELIEYQKNISAPPPGSKPFKPFAPPFWPGSTAKSDSGILPYKQRMVILDQVFDLLVELQTNVSAAVTEAVQSSYTNDLPPVEELPTTTATPDVVALNISVLDAIQAKLNDLSMMGSTKLVKKEPSSKIARTLSAASPTSFWVAYPGDANARRNIAEEEQNSRYSQQDFEENDKSEVGKDSRAIKMQMHQGYQSLPPGTIESVQAGGGSVPGHEGGGVRLVIKMPTYDTKTREDSQDFHDYQKWQDWSKSMAKEYENNHHHYERH